MSPLSSSRYPQPGTLVTTPERLIIALNDVPACTGLITKP
jgi:hypothetical protein